MIRFVCGRTGTGKSEYVMSAVKTAVSEGEDVILIVPEQQAVMWENRTAREIPPTESLSLEVLTFTRLCDRVAREYGGFFHNCAGKSAKQLLMWAALDTVRGSLCHYGSARADRLVPSMIKTVKELKTYRVSPADLEDAASSLSGGDNTEVLLSKKLSDISVIYAAYEELLHNGFCDSEELPEHTAKIIAEKGFFKGKSVFVDSFYSMTPAQKDTLRAAMADAKELVVTFACPGDDTGEPQFEHIREFFGRMRSIAGEYGGCEITELGEQRRFAKSALAFLERDLWNFARGEESPDSDGIGITLVKDRFSEGDAAAAKVCELIRQGARYSDIAVVARNMESLEGIVDFAMQKRGIPHYTARRKPLAGSPAAQLLQAVLRVPAYGWKREDLISISKTGLLPIGKDESDLFEKYVNMWRIRGRRAYTESDFGMNPFGYKHFSESRGQAILDTVNRARRTVCDPLSAFCEIFEGGRVRADKCAASLYELLVSWEVPSAISATAARLRELGYKMEAAETLRLWDALMSVLDTLATAIPDAEGDAESFSAMLSQVIAATDSGTIPTGIDDVSMGSAHMMRTENPKHVIILGAVDGEFPGKAMTDDVFTDTDRVMLEGCGIELSDNFRYPAGMELFWFYKSVCSASESVTVIVPASSGGTACNPSFGVTRIKEIFRDVPEIRYDTSDPERSVWTDADLERFARGTDELGEYARDILPEVYYTSGYGDKNFDSSVERIDADTVRLIDGDSFSLTQSKLEKFAECPFSYASTYTLGLEEDMVARIEHSDTGSFVHKILEEFFEEVRDMDFPISEETEREIRDRIFEKNINRIWDVATPGGRQKFLFGKLRRSIGAFIRSLNEEFTQGLFRPWRFEQPVGGDREGNIPSPVFYLSDGTEIRMKGVIDRIDVYRKDNDTYVRVVDYKTGSKEFSLSDIYKGLNLQLLLYLFTVWKSPPGEFRQALTGGDGEIIPAGALYFSARPGETSSDSMLYGDEGLDLAARTVSRTGLVLSDKHIIEAMDREFSGKYAPAKLDRNGDLKKSRSLADMEYFGKLYVDIADIIKEIGEEMRSGTACAAPQKHGGRLPCEYCRYFPVCRVRSRSAGEE